MATLTLPQQWAASPSPKPHWAEPRTTTPLKPRRKEISRGSSMSDLRELEPDLGTPAHTSPSGLEFEDNPVKRPPRRSSSTVGPGRGPHPQSPNSHTPSSRPQSARISRQQLEKGSRRSSSTHRTGRGDSDKSTKYRRSQSLGRTSSTSSVGTASISGGAPLQVSRSSGGTGNSMQNEGRAAKLNLYHVRRPEPRARWVFNSSHGSKKSPADFASHQAPTRVTSTVDESRPSLGGLVWINATLGGHCCLEKGTKTKTVTEVPIPTLDGWLNGQTGIWWVGALKEGHRTMWDGHVVMSWAMVFIPAYPELAAKNNMEVWKDKCIKGSRRVARTGELARKIADIVADDEDAEPECVVHTHLCILLAEGDDLDLKRKRMQGTATPRAGASGGFTPGSSVDAGGLQSMSSRSGSIDMTGVGVPPRPRDSYEGGGVPTSDEAGGMTLEEALERVEKYRDRIRALKDDRQAKKATLARLEDDLRRKEDVFARENDRLRQERNDLRARAKVLRMDVEDLRREANSGISVEHVDQLRFDVDRLRRERDDARAEAMRWLEQEKAKLEANAQATALAEVHKQRSAAAAAGSVQEMGAVGDLGMVVDANGKRDNSAKAAAAIAKLRAKVERLRKERDEAEDQAAKWLNEQQANLRQQLAADMSMNGVMNDQDRADSDVGGPIMASLQAESARLRKELEAARNEAKMLRERAPSDGVFSKKDLGELGGNGITSLSLPQSNGTNVNPEDAKKALSHLLGKALNLLSPQAAAEAAAEVAATAAANAEAASNGRGKTRLQGASNEEDMTTVQTWAHMARGEGDSDSGSSTIHNSPPVKTTAAALTPRMIV